MAQGFKLDIDNEFAEFAGEFVKHLGVELPRNMILAGQALWNSLFESTSDNLHKHPT